ncbi:MAG: ATP-binding protein [Prevotellaceae bacterium]|nr:ATP-binding protein [Prevotellaceae bacterium]
MIDEIENGLHYSAHKLLWKYILSLFNNLNIQLFITIYSIDMLQALKEILEGEQDIRDMINLFIIVNTAKKRFHMLTVVIFTKVCRELLIMKRT